MVLFVDSILLIRWLGICTCANKAVYVGITNSEIRGLTLFKHLSTYRIELDNKKKMKLNKILKKKQGFGF